MKEEESQQMKIGRWTWDVFGSCCQRCHTIKKV